MITEVVDSPFKKKPIKLRDNCETILQQHFRKMATGNDHEPTLPLITLRILDKHKLSLIFCSLLTAAQSSFVVKTKVSSKFLVSSIFFSFCLIVS